MINIISSRISEAIRAGRGTSMYLCGSPGVGKSATVRCITDQMLNGSSEFEFNVIYLNGMRWPGADLYSVIAERIGLYEAADLPSKTQCKLDVLKQFRRKVIVGKKRVRMTLLVIDEIDGCKPKADIEELLTIAGKCCGGNSMNEKYPKEFKDDEKNTSSLIVIGISNSADFPYSLHMAHDDLPRTFVFGPYSYQLLMQIISSRSCGLFQKGGIEMIARKVAGKTGKGIYNYSLLSFRCLIFLLHVVVSLISTGDARTALQLADKCLENHLMKSFGRTDVKNGDFEILPGMSADVAAIVEVSMVTKTCRDLGYDSGKEEHVLEHLTPHCLFFLVSLIISDCGTTEPANVSAMFPFYNTYLEQKGLRKCVQSDILRHISELEQKNLLEGCINGFGRRFTRVGPLEQVYKIKATPEKVLICCANKLTMCHGDLRKYIESKKKK